MSDDDNIGWLNFEAPADDSEIQVTAVAMDAGGYIAGLTYTLTLGTLAATWTKTLDSSGNALEIEDSAPEVVVQNLADGLVNATVTLEQGSAVTIIEISSIDNDDVFWEMAFNFTSVPTEVASFVVLMSMGGKTCTVTFLIPAA